MWEKKKESSRDAETDEKGIDAAVNYSKWNLRNVLRHKDMDGYLRDDHVGHDGEGEGKRKKA